MWQNIYRLTRRTVLNIKLSWRCRMLFLTDTKPIPAHRVEHLPSDTMLVCPHCLSRHLEATSAKEVWQNGARQQDRWCVDCGHRWMTVLPPRFQAELIPFTTRRA